MRLLGRGSSLNGHSLTFRDGHSPKLAYRAHRPRWSSEMGRLGTIIGGTRGIPDSESDRQSERPVEPSRRRLISMESSMAKKEVTSKSAARSASKTLSSSSTGGASKSAAGSALSQRKAPEKVTSAAAARAASKTLRDGRTSTASKSAAGSALSQRPGKKK